jgi:hypothetical protein
MTSIRVLPTFEEAFERATADGATLDMEQFRAAWDSAQALVTERGNDSNRAKASIDKLAKNGPDIVREAAEAGVTLSAWLEEQDPTESARDAALGIDAFTRAIAQLGVRTSGSALSGVQAHRIADLENAGDKIAGTDSHVGRAFMHELFRRAYVEGMTIGTSRFSPAFEAQRFYGSNSPVSAVLNPEFAMNTPAAQRMRTPLLNSLVAIQTTVPTDVYTHIFVSNQEGQQQSRRVTEGAEVGTVKLTVANHTNTVYKYGVGIEITDEAIRRTNIDMVRFHIARIAQQRLLDKEADAITILLAGDGNASTAPTVSTLTALDSGAAVGVPTTKAIMNFTGLFELSGYGLNIALAPLATKTAVLSATFGTANHPAFLGPNAVLPGGANPAAVDLPPIYANANVTTNYLLALDSGAALGMAMEAGSDKVETDRYIKSQINTIVISDVVGFWMNDVNAVRILNIGA